MKSFDECNETERAGRRRLETFLRDGAFRGYSKPEAITTPDAQLTTGDVYLYSQSAGRIAIEFKIEEERSRNFFIEEWSNLSPPTYRLGWLHHLDATKCNYIFYMFLSSGELFCIPFPELKSWALNPIVADKRTNGDDVYRQNLYRHDIRPQRKTEQRNKTWGWPVPIWEIKRDVGFDKFIFGESGNYRADDGSDDSGGGADGSQGNFWKIGA